MTHGLGYSSGLQAGHRKRAETHTDPTAHQLNGFLILRTGLIIDPDHVDDHHLGSWTRGKRCSGSSTHRLTAGRHYDIFIDDTDDLGLIDWLTHSLTHDQLGLIGLTPFMEHHSTGCSWLGGSSSPLLGRSVWRIWAGCPDHATPRSSTGAHANWVRQATELFACRFRPLTSHILNWWLIDWWWLMTDDWHCSLLGMLRLIQAHRLRRTDDHTRMMNYIDDNWVDRLMTHQLGINIYSLR